MKPILPLLSTLLLFLNLQSYSQSKNDPLSISPDTLAENTESQSIINKKDTGEKWTFHFQMSMVNEWHSNYHFPYSGQQSLDSSSETKLSMTTTLFIGRKLWKHGALYFSPEATAGQGISGTHGFAGFPNGEIYRVGNPTPTPFIARFYLQQSFAVGASREDESIEDGLNQLSQKLPASRFTINAGKFCLTDFFDNNTYSHDARTQFLNWSLMAQGAWDFPADTRGYTSGLEMELVKPKWALKYAFVMMPEQANELHMDPNILKSNGQTLEFDHKLHLFNRPGNIRLSSFMNNSTAPFYRQALNELAHGDSSLLPVFQGLAKGPSYGGVKYGFGGNIDQEIADGVGIFSRYSWNDGNTASWAFTDIDRNFQLGLSMNGKKWSRVMDNFGIAESINGISVPHREFLAAGGTTFIIGDGKLNYAPEFITETYYKIRFNQFLTVSFDYQLIFNPAYNKDRQGPISVPGLRVHMEI